MDKTHWHNKETCLSLKLFKLECENFTFVVESSIQTFIECSPCASHCHKLSRYRGDKDTISVILLLLV